MVKEKHDEEALERHYKKLEDLIDYNQKLLESVEVSHPRLDKIVNVAKEFNLHAKLTGAGGGGFAFVLLPPHVKAESVKLAKDKLQNEEGFRCWETILEQKGVSVQKMD